MTFKTPQELAGVVFAPSLPMVSGATYHWKAETAQPLRHMIDVTFEAKSCQDSMADKKWTHTATIVYDGKRLTGCAEGGMAPGSSTLQDLQARRAGKRAVLK